MHSRLASFWWKHTPSVCLAILKNQAKPKHSITLPSLHNIIPNLIPSHKNYSVDSSKNNLDLTNEIKLEDISVDFVSGNPAIENIDYDAISDGDAELLSKLKVIILETDSLFQDGFNIPSKLSTADWKYLLDLPSRSQRVKYLNFLFKKEMIKSNEKARKEARRFTNDEKKIAIDERLQSTNHLYYGLQGNTLFHRLYDSYMNNIDNFRAMNSIQLGPDIIIDMDYYDYMNQLEESMLAKQLLYIISENRMQWEPYNIIFSSWKKESLVAQKLNSLIINLYADEFPFNYSNAHFTELQYNKNELVYLTPHTNNVLLKHEPGSVYIIGGMLDKRITQPLSLAKAKKENIRAAKLPLDNFLDWGQGNKSLTLNQVMAIMNDWKRTNDWKYSFRHIPKRKLNPESVDDSLYLAQKENEQHGQVSPKFIRERKKRQLVYDLLLKR
ncbi:hypothetical protein WDU94_015069 [Cyamophila willieti]